MTFYLREVMSRYRDPQLQVTQNYVGPTLYECYANVLCLLGSANEHTEISP